MIPLLNEGQVQPSIFRPCSGKDRGGKPAPQTVAWRFYNAGRLLQVTRIPVGSDHGVKDYRHPLRLAHQAALNMIDLMRADVSGWNAEMKALEHRDRVDGDACLAAGDRLGRFVGAMKSFGRPGSADDRVHVDPARRHSTRPSKRPGGPEPLVVRTFLRDVLLAGLDRLLGQLNPWIKDLALNNGKSRTAGATIHSGRNCWPPTSSNRARNDWTRYAARPTSSAQQIYGRSENRFRLRLFTTSPSIPTGGI